MINEGSLPGKFFAHSEGVVKYRRRQGISLPTSESSCKFRFSLICLENELKHVFGFLPQIKLKYK